jgi:hypothetical protein
MLLMLLMLMLLLGHRSHGMLKLRATLLLQPRRWRVLRKRLGDVQPPLRLCLPATNSSPSAAGCRRRIGAACRQFALGRLLLFRGLAGRCQWKVARGGLQAQ